MLFKMNRISRQIIAIVFIALVFFSVGTALLIGWQSYSDLKDVAFERVQSAARLFSIELKKELEGAQAALIALESNQEITERLTLLNNYGPLYAEDTQQIGKPIAQSEIAFYLQSQLHLARSLIHLLPIHNLTELVIYHTDPFNQFENQQPLPSLIIDHSNVWLFRYDKKAHSQRPKIYTMPVDQLVLDGDVFDVSTIYQENADFFYNKVKLIKTNEEPRNIIGKIKDIENKNSDKSIILFDDQLKFVSWSKTMINLTDPDTWLPVKKQPVIILGIQEPSIEYLSELSHQLGTQLAIVDQDHVWVSSINHDTHTYNSENNLEVNANPYIYSELAISLPTNNANTFKVMALSSTENLIQRTNRLIIRLSLITILIIFVIAFAIYTLIHLKLRKPLDELLLGVNRLRQGETDVTVNIHTNNELSVLGTAFNNMTAQLKEQSDALKFANDNLEQKVIERTKELENAQEQLVLAEKMSTLGQLVAGVAHEINTPLGNSITALTYSKSEVDRIQKKFDEKTLTVSDFGKFLEVSHESLNIIDNNLLKAKELVQTFKNVAVNQSVEEVVTFSMAEHVDEIMVTLKPQLKHTLIQLHIDIDKSLEIRSYPGAYYHIISNMIMNSIRHAFLEKKGNIYLSIHANDDNICIDYRDDGQGMSDEACKKIFDPFFTTKRGEGGTGLGMYITYNIITQKLGGSIEIDSEIGKGTRFIVTLPHQLPETDSSNSGLSI